MAYSVCWCHHTILLPMAKQSVSSKPFWNFCKHQEMELYIRVSRTFFSLIVALSTLQLAPHPPNYSCRGNSALNYLCSIPTSVCMSPTTKPKWRPIMTDTPNLGHSHPETEFSQGTTSPKKSGAQALLLHNTFQHHTCDHSQRSGLLQISKLLEKAWMSIFKLHFSYAFHVTNGHFIREVNSTTRSACTYT